MAVSGISYNAYRSYIGNTNSLNKSTRDLSSGYRINSAADDAAGLAISEKMRAQITSQAAQYQNTRNEINAAQVGDGALSSVHNALGRMRELAMQASSGTYTNSDRGALEREFTQLSSQIGNIFQSTNFNGTKLLSEAQGLSSLSISTQDGALQAMESLSSAINSISGQRADFGALQNRAEHMASSLMNDRVQTQSAESEIRDLDVALAVMQHTKQKILSQTSIAMMAQANQRASGVLQLLR